MKTKKEVLEANGYDCITGYVVCDEKDSDFNNIIVTKEQLLKMLEKEPLNYYAKEHYDYWSDEDDTWDSFYNDWCDDNQRDDLSFDEWEKMMLR